MTTEAEAMRAQIADQVVNQLSVRNGLIHNSPDAVRQAVLNALPSPSPIGEDVRAALREKVAQAIYQRDGSWWSESTAFGRDNAYRAANAVLALPELARALNNGDGQ